MNITQNTSLEDLQSQVVFLNNEVLERNGKIVQLNKEVIEKDHVIAQKDHTIASLAEQLAWFKRQIFEQRSERVVGDVNSQQLWLAGFENLNDPRKKKRKLLLRTLEKNPSPTAKIKSPYRLTCQSKLLI